MGRETKIEWCHHTFSPWRGCARVSPGCANCYAETMAKRTGRHGTWGPAGERVVSSDAYWRQPLRWDRAAAKAGERPRVFCASMADVFEDRDDLAPHRARLFRLIEQTPNLDWLLLTKRPENIRPMLSFQQAGPIDNLWLGTSVEDQRRADERIPPLLAAPAAVRFLSVEPLIEPVRLALDGIHWVIVGGESGPGARPCHVEWIRSIVRQCREAGVPCFTKQLGAVPILGAVEPGWPLGRVFEADDSGEMVRVRLRDRKGGDPQEWPSDLRVRETPTGDPR